MFLNVMAAASLVPHEVAQGTVLRVSSQYCPAFVMSVHLSCLSPCPWPGLLSGMACMVISCTSHILFLPSLITVGNITDHSGLNSCCPLSAFFLGTCSRSHTSSTRLAPPSLLGHLFVPPFTLPPVDQLPQKNR